LTEIVDEKGVHGAAVLRVGVGQLRSPTPADDAIVAIDQINRFIVGAFKDFAGCGIC
jgi:hypothetical protein